MELPRLFEFNDKWANLPGADFEYWRGKLTGADRDRLIQMYEARREYSAEEQARITRPLIRWEGNTATPIRKQGETTEEWLRVVYGV
jgi:hypothetical protein